jgi:GNAT superfamily N-acetyltransferase
LQLRAEPGAPRPYTADDFAGCLRIFRSNVPAYFAPQEERDLIGFLDNLPGPYLVWHDAAGDLVACGGYAQAQTASVAVLCWGMVRRDLHGRGWGKQLLLHRLNDIAAAGQFAAVAIETSQHSRSFFERFGFRCSNHIPDGFAPGMDLYEMTLDIAFRQGGKR